MADENFELGEKLAVFAAHLDAATHSFLTDLRTFEASGEWVRQGFRTCSQWMSWRLGQDIHTAREHVRVAKALAKLPLIDEALRTGTVSYSKVRAMTRVATPANEADLLNQALFTTASQLTSVCRKYAMVLRGDKGSTLDRDRDRRHVSRRELDDGMVEIRAVLHADEAEQVWTALDRLATELCGTGGERSPAPSGPAPSRPVEQPPSGGCVSPACSNDVIVSEHHESITADDPVSEDAALEAAWAWSPRTDPSYLTVPESLYEDDGVDDTPTVTTIALHDLPMTPQMRARHRAERAASFDRATALVALADDVLRGRAANRTATEVTLTIPVEALARCASDSLQFGHLASDTCVSAETARRLCCDAGLVPLVEDADDRTIAIGRKSRTISGTLKRALLKRDRTCTFPGCAVRVFLHGHHVQHWADGGKTELANLCLLCSHHHRFVHEYGYTVEMVDGSPQYRAPSGRAVPAVPAPEQPADLGWPTIRELNEALGITASTNECGYDGCAISYADLVHALVRADGL